MVELKPCPFCGGGADAYPQEPEGTWSVRCCDCDAAMNYVALTEAEAVTAWNTRAALSGISEVVEAAEALLGRLDELHPPRTDRPTIAELEQLLQVAPGSVEIKPDGSLDVMPRTEIESFRAALSRYREGEKL